MTPEIKQEDIKCMKFVPYFMHSDEEVTQNIFNIIQKRLSRFDFNSFKIGGWGTKYQVQDKILIKNDAGVIFHIIFDFEKGTMKLWLSLNDFKDYCVSLSDSPKIDIQDDELEEFEDEIISSVNKILDALDLNIKERAKWE